MSTARHMPHTRRMMLALPAAAVAVAMFGSPAVAAPAPSAGASLSPQSIGATSQGIIMRDGGVCDPIRHMGC